MVFKVLFSVIIFSNIFANNALLHLDWSSEKYPFDRQLHLDVLDPELCTRQLEYLTTNTGLLATFIDAGIRVPRGILEGNLVDLGNYHQCLAINAQADDMQINGKYCRIRVPVEQNIEIPNFLNTSLVKFDPREMQLDEHVIRELEALNLQKVAIKSGFHGPDEHIRSGPNNPLAGLTFQLAICIPRPCTTKEMIDGILFNLTEIGFEYQDMGCRLPDDRPWVAADYVAVVVFSLIGLLTLISTSYDLYQSVYLKKDKKHISQLCTSFSVYTNTRRLLTFKSSPGTVECLDGIRALAITWVLLGHSFSTISVPLNALDALQWIVSLEAGWITVAPLTVDTFFFLSGFLLIYSTIGKLGRMQLLKNLHVFYLHRLLRLFPILAVVVLFEASLLMRASDGPLWDRVAFQVFKCREFWWSTLLYLQNIVNPHETCILVSWYLAIDVHLHILSPIVLFWVLTSNRAAWTALNSALVATVTASTVFIFFNNFPSGVVSPIQDLADFYAYYYVNVMTRASPFIVGMLYGYFIHTWRKNNMKISKVIIVLFFFVSLLTMLAVMYCTQIAIRLDWDNQLADNFFNSFLRLTWALCLGWIVFACTAGSIEPINWFLSLQMWKLPARISYAMYLIHFSIMVGYNASLVAPMYFTVPAVVFQFMAYFFITMILAFFVTLIVDSPFSTIFKLLLGGGVKKSQTPKLNVSDNDPPNDTNTRGSYTFTADESNKRQQP